MQYPWAGKTAAVPLTCMMANEQEHTYTLTYPYAHWVISKPQAEDQRLVCGGALLVEPLYPRESRSVKTTVDSSAS